MSRKKSYPWKDVCQVREHHDAKQSFTRIAVRKEPDQKKPRLVLETGNIYCLRCTTLAHFVDEVAAEAYVRFLNNEPRTAKK